MNRVNIRLIINERLATYQITIQLVRGLTCLLTVQNKIRNAEKAYGDLKLTID